MERKMTLLSLIQEQKDILFGRFPTNITNELKIMAWKTIAEKATDMGLFSKDWKFLRDITWQNWKKKSLRKREYTGNRSRIDESDKMIYELTGADLLTLSSPADSLSTSKESHTEEMSFSVNVSNKKNRSPHSSHHSNKTRTPNSINKRESDNEIEMQILKKRKIEKQNLLLDLQTELKKQEIEKVQLEIYELKTKLKIPYSDKVEYLESFGDEMETQVDPSDVLDDDVNNSSISSSSILSSQSTSYE